MSPELLSQIIAFALKGNPKLVTDASETLRDEKKALLDPLPTEVRDALIAAAILASPGHGHSWQHLVPRLSAENKEYILEQIVFSWIAFSFGPPFWLVDVCKYCEENGLGYGLYLDLLQKAVALGADSRGFQAKQFDEAVAFLETHPASAA